MAPARSLASSFSRAASRRGATPETDGSSAGAAAAALPVPGADDLPANRAKKPMLGAKRPGRAWRTELQLPSDPYTPGPLRAPGMRGNSRLTRILHGCYLTPSADEPGPHKDLQVPDEGPR